MVKFSIVWSSPVLQSTLEKIMFNCRVHSAIRPVCNCVQCRPSPLNCLKNFSEKTFPAHDIQQRNVPLKDYVGACLPVSLKRFIQILSFNLLSQLYFMHSIRKKVVQPSKQLNSLPDKQEEIESAKPYPAATRELPIRSFSFIIDQVIRIFFIIHIIITFVII
ncbi:hypothetical protein CRM22_005069 [Opisthorchis felineus]|uniref:Uncharacterized protein n=1 Tax=Opisthorchis felineus TaxID=147828 RepID=A0A4S2LSZ1_OPIFE|nr:hypothetical protein CRM22_005069 [Opisthorchis felineus]